MEETALWRLYTTMPTGINYMAAFMKKNTLKIAFREENRYGELQGKAGYRAATQAMLDEYKQQMGDTAFNAALREKGFPVLPPILIMPWLKRSKT
jgi:aminopeptidase C